MREENSFITLTYDDSNLPPDGSLTMRDWQLFAKNFRNWITKVNKQRAEIKQTPLPSLRYFQCGEYGDETGRPHFHACIFGHDFVFDRTQDKETKAGHPLYTSPTLSELWPKGKHWIGNLTFDSAAYCARYIMKKVTGPNAENHYNYVCLHTGKITTFTPEFVSMSRRPGIGKSYIDKYMGDVYPSDEVIVNGKSTRPPKFYDAEYEKINPKGYELVRARRISNAKKHEDNNTWERLGVREKVAAAKTAHHKFAREGIFG